MSESFEAEQVAEILDRLDEEELTHTANVPGTVREFAELVVEQGTYAPNCSVVVDVQLTLRERLTGCRKQDVTAMLMLGMMLGAALERDVPSNTGYEVAWREGRFTMPTETDD